MVKYGTAFITVTIPMLLYTAIINTSYDSLITAVFLKKNKKGLWELTVSRTIEITTVFSRP